MDVSDSRATESNTGSKTNEENNAINPIRTFENCTIFPETLETSEELIKAARSSYDPQNVHFCERGFNFYFNALGFGYDEFLADLKDITQFYLRYGREKPEFNNISENNMRILCHYVKKYALTFDDFPVDNEVSFRQVAAHNPIMVAHTLQVFTLKIYGSLNGLPESLAFPCGLKLIPKNSAHWKPLEILWKMWKVSFPESVVHHEDSGDYMTVDYFFDNRLELEDIMLDLSIYPPSAPEVSHRIFRILSIYKHDTLPKDFEDVFSIYAKDIWEFYCEHSTKFSIERLILDECHISAFEVFMRVNNILAEQKTNSMLIDPIYKAAITDKTLASPPKLRLSLNEFNESILMTMKRVESSDDGFDTQEFQKLSNQLKYFEQSIKSYEFMVKNDDLKVGTDMDWNIDRVRNLRDNTLRSLKRMKERADDARAAKRQKSIHENLPGTSGQQKLIQNNLKTLPENPEFSGDHGRLKRNRSNNLKDASETLKCTKNEYQRGKKYKSKSDFSHLPSVLEVISHQERILYEQRKFIIYSPSCSKGALYWDVGKRKLFWEFDHHPSRLAAVETVMEQKSKNTASDLRSMQQRIRDEVQKYFIQNPVKYRGFFNSSFQELPITDQFLSSLTKPIIRVVPIMSGITPIQENFAKMLKQCAIIAMDINTNMFGNNLDEIISDFLEFGQNIWSYDPGVTISKLWERVSETLDTDLFEINTVSEKKPEKILESKLQDPRLCKPKTSAHSNAENSSNKDSQQFEAHVKNAFQGISFTSTFWKDLEEIGLDSTVSGTIKMKRDGRSSEPELKLSLVQWLIIKGLSRGVKLFLIALLLISSSRLLRPQLDFFIKSGFFMEWVGNSLAKKWKKVKPETFNQENEADINNELSPRKPLFPIKSCIPIKQVQSEIVTENEALMQCVEYLATRKTKELEPKTLDEVSDVPLSRATLSPIKSYVLIKQIPTQTKMDSDGNILVYKPLTIRLKTSLTQNSDPRSLLRRTMERDLDQSLAPGPLPPRERAKKNWEGKLLVYESKTSLQKSGNNELDFNGAKPGVTLENATVEATRDTHSNICSPEKTPLPSFHETFGETIGANNGQISNYFESTVEHSSDRSLQIAMDRYLPQLPVNSQGKKTKQIRKVIQARMADSGKQSEPVPKM